MNNEKTVKKATNPPLIKGAVISRASKIKKARDISGRIYLLYDENDKIGHWELNKAADAISAYIRELEQS